MKRQLAFILARAQVPYHWLQCATTGDDRDETLEELPEDLQEILYNSRLSTHFKQFGKELGVQDPKSLEDVYKSHLETLRTSDPAPPWHHLCLPLGKRIVNSER
jgi:26S proteasome regulatory subunit N1